MRLGYTGRRLLLAIPTLLGLSLLVFALSTVTGDPSERLAARGLLPGEEPTPERVAEVRHELGFDRPVLTRYAKWLGRALRGDLGESVYNERDKVSGTISRALPATAALAAVATVFLLAMAVPAGIAAAMAHRRWPDNLLRLVALAAASVPGFFLAYVLVYVAAVKLHLLPVAGRDGFESVILPALTLAVGPAALVSRLLRSSLLEVLNDGYVATATAKGLGRTRVVVTHALRNASLPVLTALGGVVTGLLEGAVIVEVIFSWPGLGRMAFDAVGSGDYAMAQGAILLAGVIFITVNLAVDLSYARLDPRVRLGARR